MKALWNWLVALLHLVQAERHGRYSPERLVRLQKYLIQRFSFARSAAILFVTPVPCLVTIVALDALPLQPPSLGTNANVAFWVRSTLVVVIFTISSIIQFLESLPMAKISRKMILVSTVIVTGGAQLSGYAMSLLIGFPVPFGLVLESPIWLVLLIAALATSTYTCIKSDPAARASLSDWLKLGTLQISILFVYPVYNYVFTNAPSHGQVALSLVLGVIKLAYKNAIDRSIRAQPDMKAEVVNFSVEISNALFVTFSMQNATSIATLIVLVVVDFLHACDVFYEVREDARVLRQLELQLQEKYNQQHSTSALPPHHTFVHSVNDLLTRRMTKFPSRIKNSPRLGQRQSCFRKLWARPKITPNASIIPVRSGPPIAQTATSANLFKHVTSRPRSQIMPLSQTEQEYIEKSLALLYLTEFTVLTEFIEFIVPFVYALYVSVMAYLPNRMYFPQLLTIDQSTLVQTLPKILVYALLELLSLFLLDWMLRRQLQFSPLSQLAFVLETKWKFVQSELVLWVVYIVQSSLQHHGADYSFKFAWLHENPKS